MKQLSRDRWRILRITKNGGFNDFTNTLWKEIKKPPTNPHYIDPYDLYGEEEKRMWGCWFFIYR